MNMLIIYFRCEQIYNNHPGTTVVIDSFISSLLKQDIHVETHIINTDKKFNNGSKFLPIKNIESEVLFIGSVPYYTLIANLYFLEDKGHSVYFDPQVLLTDKDNPDYPQEYIKRITNINSVPYNNNIEFRR